MNFSQKFELRFWQITALSLDAIRRILASLHHLSTTTFVSATLQSFYYPTKGLEFRPLIRIALLSAATGFFTGVLLRILMYGS
jgi:hypothetical protein